MAFLGIEGALENSDKGTPKHWGCSDVGPKFNSKGITDLPCTKVVFFLFLSLRY